MRDITTLAVDTADDAAVEQLFTAVFGDRQQVRLGQLVDVLAHPGVLAYRGDELVGVATFRVEGRDAELAAIAVADGWRHTGAGSALVNAVADAVRARGAERLWLVTSNDNLDALRFYQRRGFRLAQLHPGGLDRARELKPHLPEIGAYSIPLRDELVLEITL